ncbi:AmpG family muropeptide MFS transporter [Pseudohongiella sp.]|uniref:Major facilitator superfamily (MFS) profile domain-containing protein n=1 Tax=marine sediment metagenome TaxID=412755 RepID=A0A0F9VZK6_9ZZZZ|nr:MFS transporter [Pseudohongiella sp.]HDZ10386.1 MFS transporter [Pseudohongiella sp.]HEA61991.1 MFS transporter [Pseudohongiella sp.]
MLPDHVKTFRESLLTLQDRRFVAIFLLGFSSGFPWVLHGSVLTLWMQSSGLSRSAIGYIGAVATVYAINWMWAPFVDKIRLPVLYRVFGQRRSWILLTQSFIVLSILLLSLGDPRLNLMLVSLCALSVAVFSATQDIAVDAYRISIFSRQEMDDKMPFAAAVTTTGWWAGYGFIGGALALGLGGETIGLAWPDVYRVLALLYVVLMICVMLVKEPAEEQTEALADGVLAADDPQTLHAAGVGDAASQRTWPKVKLWFSTLLIGPFREFFQRCGWKLAVSIFALLILFRLGDAMLGRMSLVFYVEIGFSRDEIAFYTKFFGGLMTAFFCLAGALINTRFGVLKGLFVGGVAMGAANCMFAIIAVVGPSVPLLLVTLVIDNFTAAFATVAFISFISYFTSRTYTGTQYALMSSVSNFGRTTLAASSGFLVDSLGGNWALFFVLTGAMVIPGLLMLWYIGKQVTEYRDRQPV